MLASRPDVPSPLAEHDRPPRCCSRGRLVPSPGYSGCSARSGCGEEPRPASGRILIVSGSVTPDGFPCWQWCRDVWAPCPLLSCPGRCRRLGPAPPPSPSVALATSLEAQVLRTSSQASWAVSSVPLPACCRSDGLDRLRSCTLAWKGRGHACGETPRNSAETGKTPSSAKTEPGAGRGAEPRGPRLAAALGRAPHHPAACRHLLLNPRWVGRRGRRGFKGSGGRSGRGAGWRRGCSCAAWRGPSFLPPPAAPGCPGMGVSSGSLVFAPWVFLSACWSSPCFGRGVGLDDPQRSLPTPTIL